MQQANPSGNLLQIMSSLMKRNDMRFIDKNSILQETRGKMNPADVEAEIQKLLSDGTIYTAMNENVFSLTDG